MNVGSCGPWHSNPESSIESCNINVKDTESQESEQYKTVDKYCLNYFQSCLFSSTLEDTVSELRIADQCNSAMRLKKTIMNMDDLLRLKYGVQKPTHLSELDIDPKKLGCDAYKLQKLEADRSNIINILQSTYIDISIQNQYRKFVDLVNNAETTKNRRASLKEEVAKNRLLRRELNRHLRQQHNHFKSLVYDSNSVIENLKIQVEDAALNAELCGRYTNNWQVARTEQHHQLIEDKETKPLQNIKLYKGKTDQEQHVHDEIELVISILVEETLHKIEEWMEKYEKDMEAIDLRIQKTKHEYENMFNRREALENTIAKHATELEDWVRYKREREEARLYHEKMTKCAIMVQAWWRGILVRQALGPYKIVKKKLPPEGRKKKK